MEEFLNAVDTIQRKAPGRMIEEIERESKQVANLYKRRIRQVKLSGNLSRGTKAQKGVTLRDLAQQRKDYASSVYRTQKAPHFHLFEDGHRVVPRGKGKGVYGKKKNPKPYRRYPSKGGLSFVQGRHEFKRMIDQEEPRLQKRRERMVESIFRELM